MNSYTGRGEGFAWCGRGRNPHFKKPKSQGGPTCFEERTFYSVSFPYFLTSSCITRDGASCPKMFETTGFLIFWIHPNSENPLNGTLEAMFTPERPKLSSGAVWRWRPSECSQRDSLEAWTTCISCGCMVAGSAVDAWGRFECWRSVVMLVWVWGITSMY